MKKITLTAITLLAALMLVACGSDKKKGGTARSGNNNVGGQPGQYCTGCSNSNRLYTALGRSDTGVEFSIELFTANSGVATGSTTGFGGGYYTGPVDGIGHLYIPTVLTCGQVQVPMAGIFKVQVRGQGHISGSGLVRGIEAVALGGGYEIYMRLEEANFLNASPFMRSCDGYEYGTEMNARWRITNINGQLCGNTILFGGNSLGGASSCH